MTNYKPVWVIVTAVPPKERDWFTSADDEEFKIEDGIVWEDAMALVVAAIKRLATPPSLPDEVLNCPEVVELVKAGRALSGGYVKTILNDALKPFEGIGNETDKASDQKFVD